MLFRLRRLMTMWLMPASAAFLLAPMVLPAAHGQLFKKAPCPSTACPTTPCPTQPCPAAPSATDSEPASKPPIPEQAQQPAPAEPTLTPEQFAATGEGESFAAAAPQVIGDFIGPAGTQLLTRSVTIPVTVQVHSGATGAIIPVTVSVPVSLTTAARIVNASAGAFKIAENESPRPTTRVFFSYNYFSNVSAGPSSAVPLNQGTFSTAPDLASIQAQVTSAAGRQSSPADIQAAVNSAVTAVNAQLAGLAATNPAQFASLSGSPTPLRVHREVFGFERTFLANAASFGVRAPTFQQQGDGSFTGSDFGDMSFLLKYAAIDNRDAGVLVSTGLVTTVPTSPGIATIAGTLHPVLLQPYVGYVVNVTDRFFVQGFSSLVAPTDSRDLTLLFNDIAMGYWLYRGNGERVVTGVVPTFEAHITDPLNHRGLSSTPTGFCDLVNLTEGVTIILNGRAFLTAGVVTPITGPKPFDIEALAQLNFRF